MSVFRQVWFIFIVSIFCNHHISAQGSIKGVIKCDGNLIEHAVVVLEGTNFSDISKQDGSFILDKIPFGEYKLIVSCIGYLNYNKKIKLEKESFVADIELKEEINSNNEVVVTGTMKETSVGESPIKVDLLSPTLFKKNPSPNIFEALNMVNGVQPQINCNVCNTGDIHINGMEGPYTMITIDGMPIVSGLGTVYGLSGIPNSIVKRIEIVKGPASTLYGSEAVGGLVNIITKDPATAPLAHIDAFATSQKEYNIDVSAKTTIGKTHILTGINYYNLNNLIDVNDDNFTDITQQNRFSTFNKISFSRKSKKEATLGLRYVFEDRWGGELQWTPEHKGGDSIYGESVLTNRWELIGQYQLKGKEDFSLQYSINSHRQNSAYGSMIFNGIQNIAFAQLLWKKELGLRNNILVGLPIRYTFYDDNTPGTASGDSVSLENKPQKIILPGLFIQDEYKVNENVLFLAGLRYDYNTNHGNIFSPRLAVKFNLDKNNVFRLSTGNGYRVVNLFTEDHAALTGARKVVIEENLKPETSWNASLNYQKFINHKSGFIGLEGGFFYTYFFNKIIGDFLTDPYYIFYQNLKGHAVSKGILLNADFAFTNGFKAILGTTLMDVYSVDPFTSGKIPQLHAPKISGTFVFTYTHSKTGLTFDYTGKVTGPMNLPVVPNDFRPEKSPWFSHQNFQVTKKFNFGLEVYTGVKNILNFIPAHPILRPMDPFDKKGFNPDGSPSAENPLGYSFDPSYNYAPIQGRRGFLGLRYRFK